MSHTVTLIPGDGIGQEVVAAAVRVADRVRETLHAVPREGRKLTRDLGGGAGTSEIAEAIAAKL